MLKLIARIAWWLIYCVFNLHDKAYATRRLRDWQHVPLSRLGYLLGWLFWLVLAGMMFLLARKL